MNRQSEEYQAEREARFKREREMFEKSFQRPRNYFKLPAKRQWEIDSELGILDWSGVGLTAEDKARFYRHYE